MNGITSLTKAATLNIKAVIIIDKKAKRKMVNHAGNIDNNVITTEM